MELHVARQPGQKTSPEALVRSLKRADAVLARAAAEETLLQGATAYVSPARPTVTSVNTAFDLRVPPGMSADAVLDELFNHYAKSGTTCARLNTSALPWPAPLAQALTQRGYREQKLALHTLVGYQSPRELRGDVQIIPGRAAYAELRRFVIERVAADELRNASTGTPLHPHPSPLPEGEGVAAEHADAFVVQQADAFVVQQADAFVVQHADAMMDQLDDARIEIFLARVARRPVGLTSLLTLGNVGVLLDLFATNQDESVLQVLMARMIEHCQRAQFEQVIVSLADGDPRGAFFTSLGFKPILEYSAFVRG